ncbi:hypothetical protein P692DRAFT_20880790 [Suillus brevipes Sb2]|nr:hypothetical protein P692DRAFT_20880790 [Suillus brevipes Sb2]
MSFSDSYTNIHALLCLPSMATQTRKRVQALPTHRTRVTLSKEAHDALTAWRDENAHHFKSALGDAWNGLDETVKAIAVETRISMSGYYGIRPISKHKLAAVHSLAIAL